MAMRRLLCACAASMAAVGMVTAHGGAHQKPLIVDPNADWATRHMAGMFPSLQLNHLFPKTSVDIV